MWNLNSETVEGRWTSTTYTNCTALKVLIPIKRFDYNDPKQ